MEIEEMREKLSIEISNNSQEKWGELLTDTQPGNHGINYWEVELLSKDIWVEIPKREFSFKNARFSFEVRLWGSSDESGSDMSFSKVAKGIGKFEFGDNNSILVKELEIQVDLDLFDHE